MPDMSAHTDLAPATGSAVPDQAGGPPDLGRMLVVVPAYNEAGRVGRVIADLHAALPTADVLVVNDGSADATAAEAVAAGAHVITLPVNLGYGAALQTGYKYAVRHHYDVVGQIDADGQHRPEHFPLLLERLTRPEVDVVLGSRFLDRDGHYRPSVARKLGIGLFGRLATAMTRQHVSDPTSGFQAMRLDVARFFCTDVYPADYPDADILILLHRSGFRVSEVPVQMEASPEGKSMHRGHRSFYYVYKMMLSILVTVLRPRSGRRD
jgi:glycosyltransferase involved in cell wall biosynthesis